MEKNLTAIIAGTGTLPVEACKNLQAKKVPFFVLSFFPEDNLVALKDTSSNEVITEDFCKISSILDLLKKKQTKQVLLIGKFDKKHLLKKIKLDWLAIKLLATSFSKSDKTIMEKVLSLLEDNGISVLKQDSVLDTLFLPPGVYAGKLTKELEKDIVLGLDVAKRISECDIGQTVVMKNGMVLAIEAIEGTDQCIRRGIALGKKNVVVCKGAWSNQNKKYDLPTLGPSTLKNIKEGEISALAWISSKTMIAEKETFFALANQLNITLVSQ